MTATYMHIGIPITEKKPNMIYNEAMKFWVSNVDDYDYKVEYLKFEEGTPFPEELHRRWHVAYAVDDLDRYVDDADRVMKKNFPNSRFYKDGLERKTAWWKLW